MRHLLSEAHSRAHDAFRRFAALEIEPAAAQWDRDRTIPAAAIARFAHAGYLGALIPQQHGGRGWDALTFGLLNEALGRVSPALTGVLTVQTMVAMALLKWGTREQKNQWLPRLANGDVIASFALTEPAAGSDLNAIAAEFRPAGNGTLRLTGCKRWISCAQFADVFLVFGKLDQSPAAALVPRDTAGVHIEPIDDLMGFRAAGLAQLTFENVSVPATNLLGKPGFALSYVAPVGLHYGRISTACSALGLLRGCVEESARRAATRKVGGDPISAIGTIRSLIARMGTDLEAAGLLCYSACRAEDEHRPEAFEKTLMAKYFTSRAAAAAASQAVQIHGAAGCHGSSPVSRFYRDAKVMEIIEGTTQIHEDLLGKALANRVGTMDA
jgi:alkylation response protein AidB-like acyl-CoA dehydrogenase